VVGAWDGWEDVLRKRKGNIDRGIGDGGWFQILQGRGRTMLEMRWILVGCGGGRLRSGRGVRLYYNGGMV
jgi:hypothetical protein